MVRIPEAQRTVFASSLRPGSIQAAAAPFQQVAKAANVAGAFIQDKMRQEQVTKSTELNSSLQLQTTEGVNNIFNDRAVQADPSLAKGRINEFLEGLKETNKISEQPLFVQQSANKTLDKLKLTSQTTALKFQNDQLFKNSVAQVGKTQENHALRALTTDTPLDVILKDTTDATTQQTASGLFDINKAEEVLKSGLSDVVANRAQRLINNGQLQEAKDLIEQENMQEMLGPDMLQKVTERIERKTKLSRDQSDKLNKMRFEAPHEYVRQVTGEEPPQVDFTDSANIADQLDNRIEYNLNADKKFNTELPLLDEREEFSLIETLRRQNSQQAAGTITNLARSITTEQQDLLSEQIFEKDAGIGLAISLANEQPQMAQSVLNGSKVMEEKLISMPSNVEMDRAVLTRVAGALIQPSFRKAGMEVVRARYADLIFKDNNNTGVIDVDMVDRAVEDIFGEISEINDSEVIGFRQQNGEFLPSDDFENLFFNLTEESIKTIHGDIPQDIKGREMDMGDIRASRLLTVGDGKYSLQIGGEFAVDSDGDPFILDLKAILEESPGLVVTLPRGVERELTGVTRQLQGGRN